jgi:glycosidase
MADFEQLLAAAHRRGMRLIMDLVVNHTSDQHPWFVESHKAKTTPIVTTTSGAAA